MTHVTVVQVHGSHLTQTNGQTKAVGETGTQSTHANSHNCNSLQLLKHERQMLESRVSSTANSEVLYVNVMELRQQATNTAKEGSHYLSDKDNTKFLVRGGKTLPEIHHSGRLLSRKSSIMNQNVGVTGGVFMMSDPKFQATEYSEGEEDCDSSLSGSRSSLSGSDSGVSSTIEVGMSSPPKHSTTITIDDGVPSSERGILLHVSPKSLDNTSEGEEEEIRRHHDEVISVEYSNFEVSEDLSEAAVTLEWRVIPPSHSVLRQHVPLEMEGDRGSTPTSFSSAYTVTEHGSESTGEDSETSRNHWSSQESDEEVHDGVNDTDKSLSSNGDREEEEGGNNNEATIQYQTRTDSGVLRDITNSSVTSSSSSSERRLLPTTSDDLVKEAVLSAVPSVLRRLRHSSESSSSGEESIVYSYIPCRDQREKEYEELWVANEAADPRGAQAFEGVTTPPLLPPPMGWGGSLGRVAGNKTQQPRSVAAPPAASKTGPVCLEQSSGADACGSNPSCVASIMCTVVPNLTGNPQVGGPAAPRKHYSTRQRNAETQIIKFKVVEEEPKYNENWRNMNNSDSKENNGEIKANLPTSTMTCKPTKRFSFLVRSNSMKQEEANQQNANEVSSSKESCQERPRRIDRKDSVTPSDQAILDKLATLNIETPSSEVTLKNKRRCSLFDPPCARCGEPVYPQERTEPTLRLVFHSSCFKCHHCGLRLTLKTFFRSPLDSRDTRLFCRSHVPTLDPGKLDSTRSDSSSSGKSSPDYLVSDNTSESSRANSSSPSMCIQEQLEIVKCDTIGLRYF